MTEHRLDFPAKPGPHSLDQITDGDRATLRVLAREAKAVAEVGTFIGGSAEALLEGMPEDGLLITVDNYRGSEGTNTRVAVNAGGDLIRLYAVQRLARFHGRLSMLQGDSVEAAAMFRPESLDLVFLDGSHVYAGVRADIEAWLPAVKRDGIMAGHDLERKSRIKLNEDEIVKRSGVEWDEESGVHCGVVRAVREKFSRVELPEGDTTVWWVRPEWAV